MKEERRGREEGEGGEGEELSNKKSGQLVFPYHTHTPVCFCSPLAAPGVGEAVSR